MLYLKIALWLVNATIESVENRNRNTELAANMLSPTIYRKEQTIRKTNFIYHHASLKL